MTMMKHLYLACYINRSDLYWQTQKTLFWCRTPMDQFYEANPVMLETIGNGQFMRGTDPIKSTWECPKLISNFA